MSEHPASLEDVISGQAEAAHSIFAPSSSAMWLVCAGSLIPNVLAPDDAGWEAAEGTVAHDLGEQWMRSGERPDHRLDTIEVCEGHEIPITEEMFTHVGSYIDWCGDIEGFDGIDFRHFPEERVDLSLFLPLRNQGGTADHFAFGTSLDRHGVLVITDLKYGKGVPVYAAVDMGDPRALVDGRLNGHPQTMLYALGVFIRYDHLYHFETIVIRICQPRLGYFGVWTTTRKELLRFAQFVLDRAPLCLEPNAPRTPGPKQCEWCRVQRTCPAFLAYAEEMMDHLFTAVDASDGTYDANAMRETVEMISDSLSLPFERIANPLEVPVSALEKILPMRRTVEKWFERIHEYLANLALYDEVELRMWKIVRGRTNRQFEDEEVAAAELRKKGLTDEQIFKRVMISPAQAEEVLQSIHKVKKPDAKAMLEGLTVQPPGPPTLAMRTDSRLELANPADRFVPVDSSDEL